MKKEILKKLKALKKLAEQTGLRGRVEIEIPNVNNVAEWENAINSITEFQHEKHVFWIAPKLICYVTIG